MFYYARATSFGNVMRKRDFGFRFGITEAAIVWYGDYCGGTFSRWCVFETFDGLQTLNDSN